MKDSADLHVERWRGWQGLDFDEQTEAAMTRMSTLLKHLNRSDRAMIADVGLQWDEYDTLHKLLIRDTPGSATPSELAADLMMSPAGLTGRLDRLERAGLVRRVRGDRDRRRVDIEITDEGRDRCLRAMRLRGRTEDRAMGALTEAEKHTLNRLLKKMLLRIEARD
ncbi:MAG TPA: MarR family transcriptional regulator [Segeticoccus sp.]|nr:MarR family transcriptional regulator [Segeticoccus sp.]